MHTSCMFAFVSHSCIVPYSVSCAVAWYGGPCVPASAVRGGSWLPSVERVAIVSRHLDGKLVD